MTSDIAADAPLVCTIGHSNRPLETFLGLLRANEISHVLDVRTVPRSRHNPQFNLDALPASLAAGHIAYTHVPGLGGLRHALADSPNAGWHNLSFRGYADYMQSQEFADHVEWVADLARSERCVLMCAEAVPWRCHRSMIGDALLVRGIRVEDIIGAKARKPHVLTAFARVEGMQVTYPPPSPVDTDIAASQGGTVIGVNHASANPMSSRIRAGNVKLKRAYEPPSRDDGVRILIDRLWPRGVRKADAALDQWAKDLAPSTALRKWFGHDPARWQEFRIRYAEEVRQHREQLRQLRALARTRPITLVYSAHDQIHNDAVALRDVLLGRRTRTRR